MRVNPTHHLADSRVDMPPTPPSLFEDDPDPIERLSDEQGGWREGRELIREYRQVREQRGRRR